jgi:hypothetical protein
MAIHESTAESVKAKARGILIGRRWLVAWLLLIAGLINYFDRTIVSVALPAFVVAVVVLLSAIPVYWLMVKDEFDKTRLRS